MLKNKLKTLLITLIIALLAFCPFVNADDEIETTSQENSETAVINDNETNQNIETNAKSEDAYLMGDDITIDYLVDGNAFVIANTVNITSKIGGDLFVIANTVNIENGYVYSNVFATAKTINLNGVIYDLYSTCENLNIGENGYVYRDMHTACKKANIYGTVGRNAFLNCNSLSISKDSEENGEKITAKIYGNLNYTTDNEIDIPENSIEGSVNFSKQEKKSTSWIDIALSIITSIVFTALIYLALLWLAPKFESKLNSTLTKNLGPVIGFGALTLVVISIITLLLLISGICSSTGVLIAALYAILIAVSSSILIITVSKLISEKAKITNSFAKFGIVVGIALILALLKLIPYVSAIITIICIWLGTGIIVKQLLPNKKEKTETL